MKTALPIYLCLILSVNNPILAQQSPNKAVKASQKASEKTANTAANVQQTADNVRNTVNNVKSIIRIFEPFWVQIKGEVSVSMGDNSVSTTPSVSNAETPTNSVEAPDNNVQVSDNSVEMPTSSSNTGSVPSMPSPSPNYNNDGSANLGTQNHTQFGNFLDMQRGTILDVVSASGESQNIDLVFAATTFAGKTLYSFYSPFYAKTSTKSRLYYYGKSISAMTPTRLNRGIE